MDRRDAIIAGAGLGLAGLAAARPDQQYYPAAGGAQIPGSRTGKIRANQVIITGVGPNAGLFVYNGTPANGNPPVFSVVAPGVTHDPFGNTVAAVLEAGSIGTNYLQVDASGHLILYSGGNQTIILDPARQAIFTYSPAAGASNLIASMAANAGTDSFGNKFLSGVTEYAYGSSAVQLLNGQLNFYGFTTTWVFQESFTGTTMSLQSTDTFLMKVGVLSAFVLSVTVASFNVALQANSGLAVTGGETADQLTVTNSGGNPLVQVTQTGAGGGTAAARIQVQNLGDLNLSTLVSGDTAGRIVLDSSANLAARIRFGPGNASPDCTFGRSSAGLLASDYLAFNNAGAESWNAVTFANSWANAASGANLRYKRVASPDHCVMLVGRITAPAGIVNGQNVITALPAAYQPNNQQDIAAWDNTAVKPLRFQMGTNGILTYQAGGAVAADSIDIYPCLYSLDA